MSYRAIISATLAISAPFVASNAQSTRISAKEITERIERKANVAIPAATVDVFKAGNPQTMVAGIAVTMMATLDVLRRADARGDNLVITHEPTFYSHRDTLATLQNEHDSVLAEKERFILDHGIVIWRFHDIPHAAEPDMINSGVVRTLRWERLGRAGSGVVFDIPNTNLASLGRNVGGKLGAKAVRISGDPNAHVSSVVFTQGFVGFATNRHAIQAAHPDAVIIGEDHEWETIEYVVDAIAEGRIKGLIVLGHIPSEQAGMEGIANWIRTFVSEVPVHFIPTADPFRPLR